MAWPSGRDYEVALQNPSVSFIPAILKNSQVDTDRRGLPVKRSGNFACVFRAQVGPRRRAIRCFTLEVADIQRRYNRLRQFTRRRNPPAFVGFDYRTEAIQIGGDKYPVLLMDWVEGQPLDEFISANLQSPGKLTDVAGRFLKLVGQLQRQFGVAHNDLQHGNVLVMSDGELRLVDYDGVYLPEFQGQLSPETGEPNYQHPARTATDYDVWIDNFPALVIYLSLLAVSTSPDLWHTLNKQNNLLLSAEDYRNPDQSLCFQLLKTSPDPVVARLAEELERCCALPVADVPYLDDLLAPAPPLLVSDPPVAPMPASTPEPPEVNYNTIRQIIREELQQTLAALNPGAAPTPSDGHLDEVLEELRNAATQNNVQALQTALRNAATQSDVQALQTALRNAATQNDVQALQTALRNAVSSGDLQRVESALQSLPSREQIAGVVDERLQEKLRDFITKSDIRGWAQLLVSIPTREQIAHIVEEQSQRNVPSRRDIEAMVKLAVQANLQNLATKADLARLWNVPTKTELESLLQGVATKAYIDSQLRDVPSKADLDFYLQGVVTDAYLDSRLQGVATRTDVRVLLAPLVTRAYLDERLKSLPSHNELTAALWERLTEECGRCGERSLLGRQFCANADCEASQLHRQKLCVNCQSATPHNARYCPQCGKLADVSVRRRWRTWWPWSSGKRNGG